MIFMSNDSSIFDVLTGPNTMKCQFKNIVTLAPTIFLTGMLASCGGNSGGNPVPIAPSYLGVITSVPDANYASAVSPADSLAVASQVTAIRQGSGAGLFAQNVALDIAASKHAAFLIENGLVSDATYLTATQAGGILGGHYENSGAANTTNFAGTSPQARATAAGYGGSVVELMTFGAADGASCIASIENSVYHLIALISPFVDMGIGFNPGNGSGSACAIELGVKSTTLGQLPATAPAVYPHDIQSGLPPVYYSLAEAPHPANIPATAGHPVVASLYTLTNPTLSASDIQIEKFDISASQGGTPLSAIVLANTGVQSATGGPTLTADDVIPSAGFVVLVPTTPLSAGTLYYLSFSAKVKGQSVTKDWSFTTGSAN